MQKFSKCGLENAGRAPRPCKEVCEIKTIFIITPGLCFFILIVSWVYGGVSQHCGKADDVITQMAKGMGAERVRVENMLSICKAQHQEKKKKKGFLF